MLGKTDWHPLAESGGASRERPARVSGAAGVPNRRTARNVAAASNPRASDGRDRRSERCGDALAEQRVVGEDPEAFWALGRGAWLRGADQLDVRRARRPLRRAAAGSERGLTMPLRRPRVLVAGAARKPWSTTSMIHWRPPVRAQLVPVSCASACRSLPDYMVPSAFMVLERVATDANGKVDRRALPAPRVARSASAAPATPSEETLAHLGRGAAARSGRRRRQLLRARRAFAAGHAADQPGSAIDLELRARRSAAPVRGPDRAGLAEAARHGAAVRPVLSA